MNVQVYSGSIQESEADAIILGLFEASELRAATRTIDQALEGAIQELVEGGDIKGKTGDVAILYPRGAIPAQRVMIVGLGPQDDFDPEAVRRMSARALRRARELGVQRAAIFLSDLHRQDYSAATETEVMAQAVTEGGKLSLYQYKGQKEQADSLPATLDLVVSGEQDVAAAEQGAAIGKAIARGVILARELTDLPPNICTPAYMAQVANETAEAVGLKIKVLEREQMQDLGMGALLAVAQGSDAPPRFIILEHGAEHSSTLDTLVLAGKGVTFDTGGYSLKGREGMGAMKGDMAGAAAVIGAMRAIATLDVPLHVVGLVPAADNMISGHAYRPSEVVTASNGVTIEVISTDAEGRMLLADTLVYAERFEPAAVVDIATLTGTCAAALGKAAAGLFSTDDGLRQALMSAADATAEKLWPLPLFPEYEKAIESETADIQNSGGKWGGIGSSATFLKHFVSYPNWAHIDMAGLAFEASDNPYIPGKGATGFGVRLLTEFVRRWK